MRSVLVKFSDKESALKFKHQVATSGSNLHVALTSEEAKDLAELRRSGKDIVDEMDALLVIGASDDIVRVLKEYLGTSWKECVRRDDLDKLPQE